MLNSIQKKTETAAVVNVDIEARLSSDVPFQVTTTVL